MSREAILILLCILLSISLLVFVMFGCRRTTERFTDAEVDAESEPAPTVAPSTTAAPKKSTASATLSAKEQELFSDLMNNKISDDDVKSLIKEGFLNEKMVEKFLEKLEETPTPVAKSKTTEGFAVKPPSIPYVPQPEPFADGAVFARF
jgi:Na+-transporting methylmalonyl-CoA/oxaloacetate decarboxylase gamma subunit